MKPKLDDFEREVIIAAYAAGEKTTALATEFNVTRWAITKIGRRAGLRPRKRGTYNRFRCH